jgi:hypothetical protein
MKSKIPALKQVARRVDATYHTLKMEAMFFRNVGRLSTQYTELYSRRLFFKQLQVSRPLDIFVSLYGTREFIAASSRASHRSLSEEPAILHSIPFNINLLYTSRSSYLSLSLGAASQNRWKENTKSKIKVKKKSKAMPVTSRGGL